MTPSHGEIIAGQKAYQRMRAYQRYKPTSSSAVVAFLILAVTTYNAIRMGEYSGLIFWMILILATYWQAQRQKARYQKDYEFLKELKTKYGIKVYEEIKQEPSSLYYWIFQKNYPPFPKYGSVVLP